jgi:glutamine cyclotransferase
MSDIRPGAKSLIQRTWWIALPVVGVLVLAFVSMAMPGDEPIAVQQVKVVAAYPHDPDAFTQGLVVEGNVLFEGTGHYGQSTLRRVDLQTGQVEKSVRLPAEFFGEGITILGEQLFQLTWKEQTCLVYDKHTLQQLGAHRYYEQGWGLANDGQHLYLSDGTSTIRVLDPHSFKQLRRIRVKQGRRLIDKLNELEFVKGELYANVWYSDHIARIDPADGSVLGWIDCSQVYPAARRPNREHVLNGIAYDQESGKLFVTGKNWPQLFEIEVQP